MRRIIAAVVLAALVTLGASACNVTRCTEDMSCWNCHTMGNRVCGPGH